MQWWLYSCRRCYLLQGRIRTDPALVLALRPRNDPLFPAIRQRNCLGVGCIRLRTRRAGADADSGALTFKGIEQISFGRCGGSFEGDDDVPSKETSAASNLSRLWTAPVAAKDKLIIVGNVGDDEPSFTAGGGARSVSEADSESDELEDSSESKEESEREVRVGSRETALTNSWLSKESSAASNLSRPLTALAVAAATEIANRGCGMSATIWRIADVVGFTILDSKWQDLVHQSLNTDWSQQPGTGNSWLESESENSQY